MFSSSIMGMPWEAKISILYSMWGGVHYIYIWTHCDFSFVLICKFWGYEQSSTESLLDNYILSNQIQRPECWKGGWTNLGGWTSFFIEPSNSWLMSAQPAPKRAPKCPATFPRKHLEGHWCLHTGTRNPSCVSWGRQGANNDIMTEFNHDQVWAHSRSGCIFPQERIMFSLYVSLSLSISTCTCTYTDRWGMFQIDVFFTLRVYTV